MASTTGASFEGSARTPVRSPQAGEEQEEEATTLISVGSATCPVERSLSASDIPGFGTEATGPDDESRRVTKHEFTQVRHRLEKTF